MRYYAGIDLGGTNIAAGIVDETGQIVGRAIVPTGAERGYGAVVRTMAETVNLAASAAGIKNIDSVGSIGVGVPGAVDLGGERVVEAPNLAWCDVALSSELEALCGKKVTLGNDADCAVLAETACGAAHGRKSAVMLTLGTGVGGGVIIDGRIFSGCSLGGIEPGHMTLVHGGEPCSCGNRGCVEMYASASALIRRTKRAMDMHPDSLMWEKSGGGLSIDGKTAFEAAKSGDKWAKCVIDEYISYVASAVSGLVNIFRPEIVIIGGGIAGQGDYFIKPLNAAVKSRCYANKLISPPETVAAALGNDAGIIGAAMLCMQKEDIK